MNSRTGFFGLPVVFKGRQYLLILSAALITVWASAADTDFYQQFTEAKSKTNGFLYEASLVDTNNLGPFLTNGPIPFATFTQKGELAGIKLGMTMSEVVRAWGKPSSLVTQCIIGPRFWYRPVHYGNRPVHFGNVSLSFSDDRLVLIAVYGSLAARLAFDNGLAGNMSRAECEKLLGPPALRDPDTRESLFGGEIAYRSEAIRTDIGFTTIQQQGPTPATEHLAFIAVRLEQEAKRKQQSIGPLSEAQAGLAVTNFAKEKKLRLEDYQQPDTRLDRSKDSWSFIYWDKPPTPGGHLLFLIDQTGKVQVLPGE